jgi:hypothetical protein
VPTDLHPFHVERLRGGRAAIILTAAWGMDAAVYRQTLLHLVERLKRLDAVIVDATVDSAPARQLPPNRRRLALRGNRTYPLALRDERDLDDLRRAIGRAQAEVKVVPGTKGGNPTRRLRLVISGRDGVLPHDLLPQLVGGGRFTGSRTRRRSTSASRQDAAIGDLIDYRRERPFSTARERRKFETNPDLTERGRLQHARIQNGMAAALRRYGLRPQMAAASSNTDLSFDLAWAWAGVLHVAEVKSLTARNEERQLRLGLGQVLRYRDLLRQQGRWDAVRAWLLLEREPRDRAWMSLCGALGITIAWPETADDCIEAVLGA